ncbi:dipeptide/oligopeptide/nickel ABC transporter permease DppB/OppB [Mycoplasmopsis canis UFG4]|uniref:Dipeptide/oligopeptide/nickel ABC transporter permease DppB/OppB n=2 Tax=Mycoplasmopsis canis TaxID=29555 RepID=I1A6R5_9BACT|nr:ABC transporter permease [Mycoplasmopsis canis]AKF41181.1 ABC transporter permease [Mycoplasmopsis canis]AMD81292.1 ABC transporter permease [Mycoplasmopsis canis PG 14]EIE40565.1 dipeptide/oligopeptide/nickel ABC transporter permease DppB/OppB [Mycoplasmopsis canis PG 14]EIE40708.1 dipeptide/oligopeptide/nickel ABC transporter permease DppB/OppB [Mycoplasmopsis canis UF33]EIE41990.1 dipeptide/oligopeptide/nickel ABC transporter permease DppB/OppB [Mycoplasmopsis canis UFG1]
MSKNKNIDLNEIFFVNKRNKDFTIFQKLFSFDSALSKSLIRFSKIILEFFIIGLIVITITFFLINAVPGSNSLTAGLDEAARKAIEAKYGLNLPIFQRYLNYIAGLFRGEFGISISLFPGREIQDFVWVRFYKSFLVGIFAVFLTVTIGISVGIWVGKNPGGWVDNISTVIVSIFSSVPSIIFALVLVFIGRLVGLPYIFNDKNLLTYILPGLALSLGSIIVYIKYIRTELNRELNSVHAKFAYLKGLSKNRFVWKHALKPALFPIATFFPAVIFGSFIGSIFIEQIFFIPGSGALLLQAIQTKDYNIILFLIVMFALLTIVSYATRDILYEVIDPRVRRKGA